MADQYGQDFNLDLDTFKDATGSLSTIVDKGLIPLEKQLGITGGFVEGLSGTLGFLTTATEIATATIALASNPFGQVGLAVGGLAIAVDLLGQRELTQGEVFYNQAEQRIKKTDEQRQAFENFAESQRISAENDLIQLGHVQSLSKELSNLVDANGKVGEANQGRVDFILSQLNPILGTEYELVGNQIEQYGEMSATIDQMLERKRAEILLNAEAPAYEEAIIESKKKSQEMTQQSIAIAEQEEIIKQIYAEKDTLRVGLTEQQRAEQIDSIRVRAQAEEENLAKMQAAYDNDAALMQQYHKTIDDYENNSALLMQGKTQEVIDNLTKREEAEQTATDLTGKSVEERVKILEGEAIAARGTATELGRQYLNGWNDVTYEMVEEAEKKAQEAEKRFKKVGNESVQGYCVGLEEGKGNVSRVATTLAYSALQAMENGLDIHSPSRKMRSLGRFTDDGYVLGLKDKEGSIYDQTSEMTSGIMERFSKAKFSTAELAQKMKRAVAQGGFHLSGTGISAASYQSANVATQNQFYTNQNEGSYIANVHVDLDGREVARGTAPFLGSQLAWEGM